MPWFSVRPKWRPRIGLVVLAVLLGVLTLPTAIVFGFRTVDHNHNGTPMGGFEIAALALALLATLTVAFVLTRTITGPIEALVRRSEEIGRGDRTAIRPLDRHGTAEIARLSQAFLDLASRLVDRSDYVQSFAAHVSHELKSPLTSIRGAAELLRDDVAEPSMNAADRRRFLDHIMADADRMTGLLGRLRELAQAELPGAPGDTMLAVIARDLAAQFPALAVTTAGDVEQRIGLSNEAAGVIFHHLAENAVQHGATRLDLAAATAGGRTAILVADNGAGISPGNRKNLFQPFFSTRRDQGGTGMGLGITRAMLAAHGGSIRLAESETGATFEIEVKAG